MKVAIIGHGFVGKAVEYGFKTADVEFYLVDPNYNTTVEIMYQTFTPDIIFVAVPTPMGDDGTIDSSIIESTLTEISRLDATALVVVKSTVTPNVIVHLASLHSRLVYNPEFLTERNANLDFINAEFLILGGESQEDLTLVKQIYDQHSDCIQCPVHYVDLAGAAMVKYTLNCFMATKVLFFNQINSIFTNSGTNTSWADFVNVLKSDSRVGSTHMDVPGPDGRYGYGGACFPKDTTALVKYATTISTPITVLEEVVRANQSIRRQYFDLDSRESAQNVNFNVL